jgi:hypothetical protein
VLAGVASRLLGEPHGPLLALAPEESVAEWARVAERLLAGTGIRLAGTPAPGRLPRLLGSGTLDLLFTTPEAAQELVRHSALKLDAVAGVLLLWPEALGPGDPLATLLAEVPRESQRIVVTADPAASADIVERYARRAPLVDLLGAVPAEPAPTVRSAPVAWRRRVESLADLADQLDPESLSVWAADLGDRDAISHALAAAGFEATVTRGDVPRSSLVVAYDLPSPDRLSQLASSGEVLLLVPPGTDSYVARLASRRKPIHARGLLERAEADLAGARSRVTTVLESGPGAAAWHAIAPLLERYEAPAVAASLYELWDAARRGEPAPAALPASAPAAQPVKLWVGIGKRDGVTPHDLVGALVKECAVPKEAVGRIEIRESFSLVELARAAGPEQIAERLSGKTIRKRRLAVRIDRKK